MLWDRGNPRQQGLVCTDGAYKDTLNQNIVNLCAMVDLDSIWPYLRRLDVLSVRQEEEMKFKATRSDMVRRLIDHINRGPMWRFHALLRACVISDNSYILDVIKVDFRQYEDNEQPSAPRQSDLPMDPGDSMNVETSSMGSSDSSCSFSYQDDPEANNIRAELVQPSTVLLNSLGEMLEIVDAPPSGPSPVSLLLQLALVITDEEAHQVQQPRSGRLRALHLVQVVSRKAGTQLKIFADILKEHCPGAYRVFHKQGSGAASPSPKHEAGKSPKHTTRIASQGSTQLLNCMNDTHYGVFKFNSELKAVMTSGIDITLLTFESGFNLLHEVIRIGRLELLPLIQYAGLWVRLYSQRSGHDTGTFSELTPKEYAMTLGAKGKAALEKITEINDHERLLQDVDKCAREGNVEKFRGLKARFKDRILKSAQKESAVMVYACQSGVQEMVWEVIRTETELGYRRKSADKAVAVCVDLGHHTLIQTLMEYVEVNLNEIRLDNRTAIEYTAVNGDVDTFHALRRLGAQVTPALVALAAAKNRLPFLQNILSSGVLPFDDINFRDKRGKTAAHFAAEKGHVDVLRLLLEQGLNLTLTDKRRFNLLHSAASGGSLEVVEVVLEFSRRQDYLHTFLTAKDRYLGADRCYCVKGSDGSNPAWHYVLVDRALIEVFKKKMTEGGIDVTIYGTILRSGWGKEPSAALVKEIEGQYDVVNASPDTLVDDMQPLHLAILKNHEAVALILIREMTDVNQPDRFGLTPLHLAAMRGSLSVITALMQKGANVDAQDVDDRMPVDVARANEKQEAVQLLMPAVSDQQRENLRQKLKQACAGLSKENLSKQQDPTQYQKNLLRDLEADIKEYLYDCCGYCLGAASLEPFY